MRRTACAIAVGLWAAACAQTLPMPDPLLPVYDGWDASLESCVEVGTGSDESRRELQREAFAAGADTIQITDVLSSMSDGVCEEIESARYLRCAEPVSP